MDKGTTVGLLFPTHLQPLTPQIILSSLTALIRGMESMGVTLQCTKSYLNLRKQRIKIDEHFSDAFPHPMWFLRIQSDSLSFSPYIQLLLVQLCPSSISLIIYGISTMK